MGMLQQRCANGALAPAWVHRQACPHLTCANGRCCT
eukprot:CAMPEP_0119417726 /NCGR_PEP_ID=MMETSP1335-20130426/16542_1 /TAXON_ID=259385 /ORGANISM="Chrysoculter rhomboideus, Strain RCC1486" /LENGTH=35 /DNA_ID= /DNA_START= /DNA_END= /DNA_ORIENTATION=